MAESGTNFPPQTYSSIFNLNGLTEVDNGLVRGVTPTENETREADDNTRIRDCFTSSMYWKLIIVTVLCCLVESNAICCKLADIPKTRQFSSFEEFQGNKRSFSCHGTRINFRFESSERLSRNTFISFTSDNITGIDLSNKSIRYVDDGAFTSLTCLYDLNLRNNLLTNLTSNTFINLTNLGRLDLSKNHLTTISNNVFPGLKGLTTLDLSYNNISDVARTAFRNNSMLERLNLSHNSLKHIEYLFSTLFNLTELYLDHNALAMLRTNFFIKNRLLKKLDVSGNQMAIIYCTKDSFNPRTMRSFNLSNNYLIHLDINWFVKEFSNAKTSIDLNENQFSCIDWKSYLHQFDFNNVTLAPGRNFTAKNINGVLCDNLNFTFPSDYNDANTPKQNSDNSSREWNKISKDESSHLHFKYVIIVLSVIALGFCMLLTLDYLLDIGFRQRVTGRIRFYLRPTSVDSTVHNSSYVQLVSAS